MAAFTPSAPSANRSAASSTNDAPMDAVRIVGNALAAASLAALVYHYLGYPLVLRILGAFAPERPAPPGAAAPPSVSVIVPCYNEVAEVAAKIADIRAAGYPQANVEIIVVSDGSDDGTAAAAEKAGARVVSWSERRGKAAALNAGADAGGGDVLVFTDANARWEPAALRELVAPFADPAVGAVCGEQVVTTDGGERWYWRYEAFIKKWEAALGSPVGADGSLYAVRRELFRPLPEGRVIMDDFYISLAVVAAGKRMAYAPRARALEGALPTSHAEFRRKARIMNGSLAALAALDGRIFLRIPWQLFSHKILRWLGPAFLAAALAGAAAAALAGSRVALVLLILQLAFYVAAAAAAAWPPRRAPAALHAPLYFVVANAALAVGWWRYLLGRDAPAWPKLR